MPSQRGRPGELEDRRRDVREDAVPQRAPGELPADPEQAGRG